VIKASAMTDVPPKALDSQHARIFLSWSGERSRYVATVLREWLPNVIQQLDVPFMSEKDIEKGTIGLTEIDKRLDGTLFGVVILTPENQARHWINFEAGAIGRSLEEWREVQGRPNRVCTVLVDLTPTQVVGPLSKFQHTELAKQDDVELLLKTINKHLRSPLGDDRLKQIFKIHWPDLAEKLKQVPKSDSKKTPARETGEVLEELTTIVRSLSSQVDHLGARVERMTRGEIRVGASRHGAREIMDFASNLWTGSATETALRLRAEAPIVFESLSELKPYFGRSVQEVDLINAIKAIRNSQKHADEIKMVLPLRERKPETKPESGPSG
jgi:hypothetical protein